MTNERLDTIRADFERESRARSGGYPGMMRKATHATSLGLIGIWMVLVFIAMLGDFPMNEALQLSLIVVAPLTFIAFLSRPRR